jgi:hypothetical protein
MGGVEKEHCSNSIATSGPQTTKNNEFKSNNKMAVQCDAMRENLNFTLETSMTFGTR